MKNRSIKLLISVFMILALAIVITSALTRYNAEEKTDNTTTTLSDQTTTTISVAQTDAEATEPEVNEPTTAEVRVPLPVSMHNPPPVMPEIGTGLRIWPEALSIPLIREPDLTQYIGASRDERPLEGITVILDPGHGGQDGGAQFPIGVANPDYVEKEVVLDVSFKIRDYLEELGATVFMTREEDVWLSIYARIAVASQYLLDDFMHLLPYHGYEPDPVAHVKTQLEEMIEINSDYASSGGRGPMLGIGTNEDMRLLMDVQAQYPDVLFLSIHCNALEDLSVGGLQVFYQTGESAWRVEHEAVMYQPPADNSPAYGLYPSSDRFRLAETVHEKILERIPELQFSGNDILEANFAVLREMNMTSILLEMGFITNERDRAIMTSEQGQDKIAQGVADAVYHYYTAP